MLQVARENQLSSFGTVSLDGTKIQANANRHSALSDGYAEKIEVQLNAEVGVAPIKPDRMRLIIGCG